MTGRRERMQGWSDRGRQDREGRKGGGPRSEEEKIKAFRKGKHLGRNVEGRREILGKGRW